MARRCQTTLNNPCDSYPDTKCIVYSGADLTCIDVKTNDRLDVILAKINQVICDGGGGGGGGDDEKVKISLNDTTTGYLIDKLVEGIGITLTENNDGGNETLSASLDTSYTDGLYWKLLGNAGTAVGTNFIGTTDAQSLLLKVASISAGIITYTTPTGNVNTDVGSVALGHYALDEIIKLGPTGTMGGNVAIGTGAGRWIGYTGVNQDSPGRNRSAENTLVGLWAGHYLQKVNPESNLGRNVAIGESAMYRSLGGSDNVAVGNFSQESGWKQRGNTSVGRDSLRSIGDGYGNVAIGALAQAYSATGVGSITVTDGGSGYTTAVVTISSPTFWNTPGTCWGTATATATINAGVITAITVTDPGCGYSSKGGLYPNGTTIIDIGATVTITGDGVGATATANMVSNESNTSLGSSSGLYRRMGTGNLDLGYAAGSSTRFFDTYTIMMGTGSSVDASIPAGTIIDKAIAIGYNAKVAASSTMALGGTGVDAISVVIGATTATAGRVLDVRGEADINGHRVGRGPSNLLTNIVIGSGAAASHSSGNNLVVIGNGAFPNSTTGRDSVIIGQGALTGGANLWGNVYIGYLAGALNSANTASQNRYGSVAIGHTASYNGGHNRSVAIGTSAMYNAMNAAASYTTAVGDSSLYNVTSSTNTALGGYSGYSILSGVDNIAIGICSMGAGGLCGGVAASTGSANIAIGRTALFNNTSGQYNIAIGYNSGTSLTTESYNVILGGNTGADLVGLSNHILLADGQGNKRIHIDNTGVVYVQTVNNDNAESKLLTWNSVTKDIEYRDASSISGTFALTNGSGTTVGGDTTSVDLGGTLTADANILLAGFDFNIKTGTYTQFGVSNTEIYGSIKVSGTQYSEYVQDDQHILNSILQSGHHAECLIESAGTGATTFGLLEVLDGTNYKSEVLINNTGVHLKTGTTTVSSYLGIDIALTGEVSFDVVNNDNTEDKLLTWNNVSKNIEYRTVASLAGGGLSLAAIGASPNANAATLTAGVLNLEPASVSFGGVVTTGTQTFEGYKTFNVGVVVNESGVDSDFRVEGDTKDHLFFVDASKDEVNIGFSGVPTDYGDYILQINGGTAISRDNTDYTNTGGAGSVLYMKNPNATGQSVVYSEINGTMAAKWRTDYVGNINWVSAANSSSTGHNFFVNGDYGAGTIKMLVSNSGVSIGSWTASSPSAPTASLTVFGSSTFNEDGGDFDTRIEGDTDPNTIFVDASTDSVGFKTNTPTSHIHMNGSQAIKRTTTSADLTLTIAHYYVTVDASGAARTITLPTASGIEGRVYIVRKSDSSANTVTVDGDTAETINGAANYILTNQYEVITVVSDGANWEIL